MRAARAGVHGSSPLGVLPDFLAVFGFRGIRQPRQLLGDARRRLDHHRRDVLAVEPDRAGALTLDGERLAVGPDHDLLVVSAFL